MNNKLNYFESIVLSTMNKGRTHAVTQAQIHNRTGLPRRNIRHIMQELRHKGYPICSTTTDGYWLAETKSELNECICQLSSQVRTLQDTIVALLAAKAHLIED